MAVADRNAPGIAEAIRYKIHGSDRQSHVKQRCQCDPEENTDRKPARKSKGSKRKPWIYLRQSGSWLKRSFGAVLLSAPEEIKQEMAER